MNFLPSFLFASSFVLATFSSPLQARTGDETPVVVSEDAARELLTGVIREGIRYPEFQADPNQEVIVRIRFQVDEQNRIHLLDVAGNNRQVVDYVESHLEGKTAGEQPVLPGVTFVSTLRFIR